MKKLSWILVLVIAVNSLYYFAGSIIEVLQYKSDYIDFFGSLPPRYIFFHFVRTLLSLTGFWLFFNFVRKKDKLGKIWACWWAIQLIKIYRLQPHLSGKFVENKFFDFIVGFSIPFVYSPSDFETIKSEGAMFIGINMIAIVGLIFSMILISYNMANSADPKNRAAD